MGGIIANYIITENDNEDMTNEQKIKYWKCNNKRIKSREYYKNNKDEWYLEYMF